MQGDCGLTMNFRDRTGVFAIRPEVVSLDRSDRPIGLITTSDALAGVAPWSPEGMRPIRGVPGRSRPGRQRRRRLQNSRYLTIADRQMFDRSRK